MKPKSFLCALMLFLSVSVSFAQQSLTCRGTVRDRSGQPMPGVAVLIKGTQVGSMTDINGYYVVDVPSVGTELEFLCMGYKTQVQKVPKSLNLDVFLDEFLQQLIAHEESAATLPLRLFAAVEAFFFKVVAVFALHVAQRAGRFGHQIEKVREGGSRGHI